MRKEKYDALSDKEKNDLVKVYQKIVQLNKYNKLIKIWNTPEEIVEEFSVRNFII